MINFNNNSIHFTRQYNVSVERLYQAWSDPQLFRAWWKDLTVAEMNFKLGGEYRLEWKDSPGHYTVGTYREIQPNAKIVMSWETPGNCSGTETSGPIKGSVITIKFTSLGANLSRLEFLHEGLPATAISDHHLGWTCAFIDADKYFNEPTRPVREDLKAVIERTMPFSVDKVWDAWSKPEFVARWFNSAGAQHGTAGGKFAVPGQLFMDYQMKSGDVMRIYTEYIEITPKSRIVFKWADDGHDKKLLEHVGHESRVTVSLKDLGGKTQVTIVHDHLVSEGAMADYQGGWTDCLRSIEEELTKG